MTMSPLHTAPFSPLKHDATVIGLVGLAHASSHFGQLALPALFPVFVAQFGLSYSELGLLMTGFFAVSGVGQAGAGFAVDRWGARALLFAAVGVLALACSVAALASGYYGLLCAALLAGLANAAFHPVDFTILNQKVSPARLGYAFSVHGLTGNLGWAAAPVFFVGIAGLAGWRVAYATAAVAYLALLALLFVMRDKLATQGVRRAAADDAVRASARTPTLGLVDFMKLPVVWWCFGFFFLSTVTLAVVQNFSVSILQALYGVSFQVATLTLTAYMTCGAVGMFLGGMVVTRWAAHSERVLASAMGVSALLLALCGTQILSTNVALVVFAATGFAMGVGGPSRDMMIRHATPKGATGRVYGLVYSGLDAGFALSPLIFGAFMDRGWYDATLIGAALVLLFSVWVALGVGHKRQHA